MKHWSRPVKCEACEWLGARVSRARPCPKCGGRPLWTSFYGGPVLADSYQVFDHVADVAEWRRSAPLPISCLPRPAAPFAMEAAGSAFPDGRVPSVLYIRTVDSGRVQAYKIPRQPKRGRRRR